MRAPGKPRKFVTKILATGAAVACVVAMGATGATAAPVSPDTPYPGSVPSWAQPSNDQGAAAADTSVEGELFLSLRNQDGAKALAEAVSNPRSSKYHKPLSPAQWIARYSPSKADYADTVSFLKSKGLTITGTPDSRQYVVFRGTAAQVNAAFGAQLHRYDFKGTTLVGPSKAPQLPKAVAAHVVGVTVDQGAAKHPNYATPDAGQNAAPQARTAPAAPTAACSNYFGQNSDTVPTAYGKTSFPTNICGYTPSQIQSAYGRGELAKTRPGNGGRHGQAPDGRGQTVAIIDAYASPTILADANAYSTAYGLPPLNSSNYRQIVPSPPQFKDEKLCSFPSGWQPEQSLDVDAVHGTAPGAKILYVGGDNCNAGIDLALSTILDGKLANIVSNSYGNQGEAVSANYLFGQVNLELQAAGEGIGLYYSSGDNGDEAAGLGYASPDFPASSPWVTAVGGTSLAIAKNGSYQFETGWGDTRDQIVNGAYSAPLPGPFRFGAGGGVSAAFAQPAYQKDVVPNSLANGKRVSPDVSSVADPYTGYVVGISSINDNATLSTDPFAIFTYGGTSLACPLTAGQMAVAQQVSGKVLGFANPAIYAASRQQARTVRDVVPPRTQQALAFTSTSTGGKYLVSLNLDTSLTTARGYDDVTGLGSMNYQFALAVAQQRRHGG
ncbi:S53 family peptidase [Arthrobacter dokdonensis]|uniref:S53 family peptidase n=1 Tax=Arthrobacter dokdonellae TaxID=2211210 RepID=UPI001D1311E1|nr:S53 family peptidase [Arthrobacter dokdonellae]